VRGRSTREPSKLDGNAIARATTQFAGAEIQRDPHRARERHEITELPPDAKPVRAPRPETAVSERAARRTRRSSSFTSIRLGDELA
jgi:hypothetical protein